MRVCILICPKSNQSEKLLNIGKALASSLESKGNIVDILSVYTDSDKKLSFYDYLVVISEPMTLFGGKINPKLKTFLSSCGQVSGKRAASIISSGIRKNKAMYDLMRTMESEGIILKTSEIITKAGEAKVFGSKLNVERNYK